MLEPRDWSPAEDLRPGAPFRSVTSTRGKVYTVPMTLDWKLEDAPGAIPCWTWLTVRDCSGDVLIEKPSRIFQRMTTNEDDGA